MTPEGTTLYIAGFGVLAELSGPGTTAAKWTDYLSVGNAKVGMRVLQAASETLNLRYFHTDHLGSISVITNESGVVQERLSFDAWGKRRNPDGTDDTAGSITSQTTRGFTGQEELSVAGLVHLNGRVYDPLLARMTSPDPTVTDPSNPQGWNRYSYVGNDPLAFTDPNGFSWLSEFFHSVTNFFSSIPILRSIVQIATTIILTPLVGPIFAAAAGAALVNGLSGGNLASMLKSAAISGLTALAFWGVGSVTNAIAGVPIGDPHIVPEIGTSEFAFNVAGHAAVGCGSSLASGGSCASGALSGAAGSVATSLTADLFPLARTDLGQRVGGTVVMATAGGLGAVAGGGKFADGAVTGAFGYLFNAEVDCMKVGRKCVVLEGGGGGGVPRGSLNIFESVSDFVVSRGGTAFPVPKGATGPTEVVNPAGNVTGSAFTGGAGGANGQVSTMRIMDPTPPRGSSPGYPNGYIKYENETGQGVDPYTGRTLPNTKSHFPID